jgi:hypothetical protein
MQGGRGGGGEKMTKEVFVGEKLEGRISNEGLSRYTSESASVRGQTGTGFPFCVIRMCSTGN